jgi:hypothetical protein
MIVPGWSKVDRSWDVTGQIVLSCHVADLVDEPQVAVRMALCLLIRLAGLEAKMLVRRKSPSSIDRSFGIVFFLPDPISTEQAIMSASARCICTTQLSPQVLIQSEKKKRLG